MVGAKAQLSCANVIVGCCGHQLRRACAGHDALLGLLPGCRVFSGFYNSQGDVPCCPATVFLRCNGCKSPVQPAIDRHKCKVSATQQLGVEFVQLRCPQIPKASLVLTEHRNPQLFGFLDTPARACKRAQCGRVNISSGWTGGQGAQLDHTPHLVPGRHCLTA